MPKICYRDKRFKEDTLYFIEAANNIIDEYLSDGYRLTLRQLYYQFVARGLLENTLQSYGKLGNIVNDGRLAGYIDWNAIEDRTRNLQGVSHWDHPSSIVEDAASSFRLDKWEDQKYRLEVWIEKEALAGVIERICRELDIDFFSCRGYVSQSEMWSAAMRLEGYYDSGQIPIIIHLGDHDPSGIDMTRDIQDRMDLFTAPGTIEVVRIALNRDQIDEFKPPPNPAKTVDPRFRSYVVEYGNESWELDALDPRTLTNLINKVVLGYREDDKWQEMIEKEEQYRTKLSEAAEDYDWE